MFSCKVVAYKASRNDVEFKIQELKVIKQKLLHLDQVLSKDSTEQPDIQLSKDKITSIFGNVILINKNITNLSKALMTQKRENISTYFFNPS
ncbi:MAG: hypothetical protein RLZZ210_65 [Pseudomonadota bacterium]|jgi:hypothetical protein